MGLFLVVNYCLPRHVVACVGPANRQQTYLASVHLLLLPSGLKRSRKVVALSSAKSSVVDFLRVMLSCSISRLVDKLEHKSVGNQVYRARHWETQS